MAEKLTDNMPESPVERAIATAQAEFACHRMHVIHANGLYRHLRFANPTSSFYSFSIMTWPGYLSIFGDVGTEVWMRDDDMLDFFDRDGRPDFRYWAEKIQTDASPYEFSERRVREWVENQLEHWDDEDDADEIRNYVVDDVLGDDLSDTDRINALYLMRDLAWDGDADIREISYQAALRMLAVQHAALAWARYCGN